MKSMICAALAVAVASNLAGCATVIRGTTSDFKVTSSPPGASVRTSNGYACAPTPCVIRKMARNEPFNATFKLAGYKPQVVYVHTGVKAAGVAGVLGNAVVGGVIGVAIDATDGSMYDFTPNPLEVTLEPGSPSTASAAEEADAEPILVQRQ